MAALVPAPFTSAPPFRAVSFAALLVTLALAALFQFALPESLEYLINRGNDRVRAVRTNRYKYIRNYMPENPYTAHNADVPPASCHAPIPACLPALR